MSEQQQEKVMDPVEKELEQERKALADIEARREARLRAARAQKELDETRRARKEAEKLEELEGIHGELDKGLRRVDTDEGMIVVKRPNHLHYKRFVDKGKTTTEELSKLVRPCVVYPDKAEFDRILEEAPAALVRCADAVCWLAGMRKEESEGK